MSAFRFAASALGVAITLARHPMVRAGIKAAPLLITPKMRAAATQVTLDAAYQAGVIAGRIVKRN